MGIGDDEIWEAIQVAASCGAGTIIAMAERSQIAAEKGHKYWLPPR